MTCDFKTIPEQAAILAQQLGFDSDIVIDLSQGKIPNLFSVRVAMILTNTKPDSMDALDHFRLNKLYSLLKKMRRDAS